jgi:hypothetical protein
VADYLLHTATGTPLREIARRRGRHPSTVLRQVRRFEGRRDDPLVDAALAALCRQAVPAAQTPSPAPEDAMTAQLRPDSFPNDAATLAAEARRVLRRLIEPGTVLAVAVDMDRAAVLRTEPGGQQTRLCVP